MKQKGSLQLTNRSEGGTEMELSEEIRNIDDWVLVELRFFSILSNRLGLAGFEFAAFIVFAALPLLSAAIVV